MNYESFSLPLLPPWPGSPLFITWTARMLPNWSPCLWSCFSPNWFTFKHLITKVQLCYLRLLYPSLGALTLHKEAMCVLQTSMPIRNNGAPLGRWRGYTSLLFKIVCLSLTHHMSTHMEAIWENIHQKTIWACRFSCDIFSIALYF